MGILNLVKKRKKIYPPRPKPTPRPKSSTSTTRERAIMKKTGWSAKKTAQEKRKSLRLHNQKLRGKR